MQDLNLYPVFTENWKEQRKQEKEERSNCHTQANLALINARKAIDDRAALTPDIAREHITDLIETIPALMAQAGHSDLTGRKLKKLMGITPKEYGSLIQSFRAVVHPPHKSRPDSVSPPQPAGDGKKARPRLTLVTNPTA